MRFCVLKSDSKRHLAIAILQNNASHPICQSVKYCVRNLCRASARLQISSLSFALCQIVLPALFYWIAISGSLQSSGETLRQKSFLSFYSIIGNPLFVTQSFLKNKVTVQNHLQNAAHFVGVAYPPNRFPCKSVHSCKHDSHFCMKICLALNSYILFICI